MRKIFFFLLIGFGSLPACSHYCYAAMLPPQAAVVAQDRVDLAEPARGDDVHFGEDLLTEHPGRTVAALFILPANKAKFTDKIQDAGRGMKSWTITSNQTGRSCTVYFVEDQAGFLYINAEELGK